MVKTAKTNWLHASGCGKMGRRRVGDEDEVTTVERINGTMYRGGGNFKLYSGMKAYDGDELFEVKGKGKGKSSFQGKCFQFSKNKRTKEKTEQKKKKAKKHTKKEEEEERERGKRKERREKREERKREERRRRERRRREKRRREREEREERREERKECAFPGRAAARPHTGASVGRLLDEAEKIRTLL